MKLTDYQRRLLKECLEYSLCIGGPRDHGLYRLGGHGMSPVRVHNESIRKLQNAGLLVDGSVLATSHAGKLALESVASK